jgi:salicylate biosynthesis isochorismate synthase/menaquinone-specific isochorismate synthase
LERLSLNVDRAIARSRSTGEPTLAAVSEILEGAIDPTAVVAAAGSSSTWWGVMEQPDRGGSLIATLGCELELSGSGADRFANVSAQWSSLANGAFAEQPDGPAGSGCVVFGGFAFSDQSTIAGPWRGFNASSMVVPTVAFRRRDGELWLTTQVVVAGDDLLESVIERVLAVLEGLDRDARLPELEDRPGMPPRIGSVLAPEHYESAVNRALEAIEEGRVDKVVLAREVLVERESEFDPPAIFGVLREVFPTCFLYAVGRDDAVFIGASPELLIRREGSRASTVALAGSTPRSADPAVDSHLGERLLRSAKDRAEQGIVTDRIRRSLEPLSVWVAAQPEPVLAQVANVQHLATPIRAQLRKPVSALQLAVVAELEGLDRGWYAGPVGWTDAAGNGEFCVGLRCALIRGGQARCYAGVGVVEGSTAESELAETELKLQAILPVVSI